MEIARIHRYYKTYHFGPRWLLYQYLLTDAKLRNMLDLGPFCGTITFITGLMILILLLYSYMNEKATNSNEKDFQELQKETNKKIPRKKSVADIRPIYNCIHKHVSLFSSRCAPCGKCIPLFCLRISWCSTRNNAVKQYSYGKW